MDEQQTFFSATKSKVYVTAGFVALRFLLGYLNRLGVQAKIPFFVNMIITAVDFVVSLPMKLVFGTKFLKALLTNKISLLILFVVMLAYWYVFACVLVYAYELLNKQDEEHKSKHEHKPEVQSKLE